MASLKRERETNGKINTLRKKKVHLIDAVKRDERHSSLIISGTKC